MLRSTRVGPIILDQTFHFTDADWDDFTKLWRRLCTMRRRPPDGWYTAHIESSVQEISTFLSKVHPVTRKPILTPDGGPAVVKSFDGYRLRLRPTLYTLPGFEVVVPPMWGLMKHNEQVGPVVRFRLVSDQQQMLLETSNGSRCLLPYPNLTNTNWKLRRLADLPGPPRP